MRVGQLKDLVSLINSNGDDVGSFFVDIDDKNAKIPFDSGLKNEGETIIRARYLPEITRGCYLKSIENRLFYIANVRDIDGKKKDLILTVVELIGAPAELDISPEKTVRCALLSYRAKPESENDYLPSEVRKRAEFAVAEWAPVVGVEFTLAGAIHKITEIDNENSDALVARVWIDFIEYSGD